MVIYTDVSVEELMQKFPKGRFQKKGQELQILAGDKKKIVEYLEGAKVVVSIEEISENKEQDMEKVEKVDNGTQIVVGIENLVKGVFSTEIKQVEESKDKFILYIDKLKEDGKKTNELTLINNAKVIGDLRDIAGDCVESVKALEQKFNIEIEKILRQLVVLEKKNKSISKFFIESENAAKSVLEEIESD